MDETHIKIVSELRGALPLAEIIIDGPNDYHQYWINCFFDNVGVAVIGYYNEVKGRQFGVSSHQEDDFLTHQSDEIYLDVEEAIKRTIQLLKTGEKTTY